MVERADNATTKGTVLEALPNTMFKVALDDDSIVLVYLSGRMRLHHIKVLVGDKVELVMDSYGQRGRITKRL